MDAATASIQRVLAETTEPLKRAGLLPACVEIMLAAGDADAATVACVELEELAERFESSMLGAMVAYAPTILRALRALLKAALRRYGLKCLSVEKVPPRQVAP